MNTKRGFISKTGYQLVILALLFLVGFLYMYEPPDIYADYLSDYTTAEIDQSFIRLVYVGSSGCIFSNSEATHQLVNELKTSVRSFANEIGYRYLTTGISIDASVRNGIDFLEKTAPYDELVAGNGWFNLGAYQYIWDTLPGPESTPQVLIVLSSYSEDTGGRGFVIRDDQILERVIGVDGIQELQTSINRLSTEAFALRLEIELKRDMDEI